MTELLTSAQMRAIEAAAIASGEVTGLELMERAGHGVVQAVLEEWPDLALTSHRAVVLCGPGGNGGDGFVVARLLKARGWEVEVFLYGDVGRMPPDARVNYERWVGMGEVRRWPLGRDAHDPWNCVLIVDALFGIGLARPIAFGEVNVGRMLPEWDLRGEPNRPKVVAIDVPSGLCADSGRTLQDSDSLWADLTVTFHAMKAGHFLGDCANLCGNVVIKDIGLDPVPSDPLAAMRKRFAPIALTLTEGASTQLGKGDPFGRETHKFTHGHALILSGPPGRGGAARLSARGALRVGAGVVTMGAPPDAIPEHAARLDAVMLRAVGDAAALAGVLEDGRINALCLGPGLGVDARAAGLVGVALDPSRGAPPTPAGGGGGGAPRLGVVLDADALTLLSRDPALFGHLHDRCILTPHAGEFARLFPDIAAKLDAPATTGPAWSKVDATREAAKRAGCVVLYKGPDTVIADPSGRCSINSAHYDRSAPWLATAGSGDVLAGFICGLLARGFQPMQAAETAAWLHVECARAFGPGLIAEDLPEMLPQVFRSLGL